MSYQPTAGDVLRHGKFTLQARGHWFEPSCAHQPGPSNKDGASPAETRWGAVPLLSSWLWPVTAGDSWLCPIRAQVSQLHRRHCPQRPWSGDLIVAGVLAVRCRIDPFLDQGGADARHRVRRSRAVPNGRRHRSDKFTHQRALIGRALYLPEGWAADEERRELAGVPDEITFETKPQLAGDLLQHAHDQGIRAGFVAGDEVYGGRDLRESIRARGAHGPRLAGHPHLGSR